MNGKKRTFFLNINFVATIDKKYFSVNDISFFHCIFFMSFYKSP